jgi:hypothetical protein
MRKGKGMADYSKMEDEEFDEYLIGYVIRNYGKGAVNLIFDIPNMYDEVSEVFNNDILDMWAEDHPELAYPEDEEEEE